MSILGGRSTRSLVRGKNPQFLSVLFMTVLFIFMTTIHYNQIYASLQGGTEAELNGGSNTTVKSAKTKIKKGAWNTGDQTVGLQGHSSIIHNGKAYSVWWQIGRGTNPGGNNRVVAEIGWNEAGTDKYGAQTHLFTHSVGDNDFFEVDPKGNGEVDFKFDGTTETLDWNDSDLWNTGAQLPTGLQWDNNEDVAYISTNAENGPETSSTNLPGTQSNPFEFSDTTYDDGSSTITLDTEWQRIGSSPSTLVTDINASAGTVTLYD